MPETNGLKLDLRTTPDSKAKLIKLLVEASWLVGLVTLIFSCITIPALKTFFNTYLHLNLALKRNQSYMQINLALIIITFIISLIGIFLNSSRNRRRDDRFYSSLIAITILSGLYGGAWLIWLM